MVADRVPAPQVVADAIRETYGDSLRGVRLDIRLIPRGNWEAEQHGELMRYWDAVFAMLGVQAEWNAL
jgi:hypothetical protein